jgi:glycosyltransferase involved in cell wall biosynthesis
MSQPPHASRRLPEKLLFAVPFPIGVAPSQRFRFEQYFQRLDSLGVEYDCAPFWDGRTWEILYRPGRAVSKALGLATGFARRLALLARLSLYDAVYVHREMSPVGPPIFEWIAARVFRKPIVYDFDDAIWLENVSSANPFAGRFKNYRKVAKICGWADRVSAGNEFLANFARRFNEQVVVFPTVVDTDRHHNRVRHESGGAPVIGWTGTHSTVEFLRPVVPLLQALSRKVPFEFTVIADREPEFQADNLRFVRWNRQTEIEDLLRFDIGVMPVPDNEWTRGKCGFKIIQYMSLGIPPVASPVGVNRQIIENGVDGFLCATEKEWRDALERLLTDPDLRTRMGGAARDKVVREYSVAANEDRFLAGIEGLDRAKERGLSCAE